jgi:hypothetical protein
MMSAFNGMDWAHIGVGLAGLLLIFNAILSIISSSYFSKLSKVFFIEPMSVNDKLFVKQWVNKKEKEDRYVTVAFCLFLGTIAIAWAVNIKLLL